MKNTINNGKGLRRFIWKVCAFSFLDDCVFIYTWYAVMFADRGLSAAQISVLFAVWSIVAFLLEVPSGALADKYSRRHILAFAQAVRICGYTCWMLFPTLSGFLVGFILWGVKSAFMSGTFEALVYDELKHFGDGKEYGRIIGRVYASVNAGLLVSAAAAVPMIRLGYRAVILASLVPLCLSSAVALSMRPAKNVQSTGEVHYVRLLKEGVREAFRNPAAFRLIAFISFALIFSALDEYYSLFFKTAGISVTGIGILVAAITVVQMMGDAVAYRFNRWPDRAFYLLYSLGGLLVLIGAYVMTPAAAACIVALSICFSIIGVVMETRLQHAIEGRARATVTSVKGFVENVMAVVIYLTFGAVSNKLGYRGGFMAFGAAMVVIGLIYTVSTTRAGRSSSTEQETLEEAAV